MSTFFMNIFFFTSGKVINLDKLTFIESCKDGNRFKAHFVNDESILWLFLAEINELNEYVSKTQTNS